MTREFCVCLLVTCGGLAPAAAMTLATARVATVRYRDVFRRQDVMVRRLCSAIAEQHMLAENADGQQPTRAALLHNFEDGFQVQRAVEAALRSSRKGRWVRLDDVFNPALDGV